MAIEAEGVEKAPELPEISPWGYVIALLVATYLASKRKRERAKFLRLLARGCDLMGSRAKVISIRASGASTATEGRNRVLAANWVREMIPVWESLARIVEEE